MRVRFIIVVFLLTWKVGLYAQTAFCVEGSRWYFTEKWLGGGDPRYKNVIYNHEAFRAGDTIIDNFQASILLHDFFFKYCGRGSFRSYVRQTGDTVFFRNDKFTNGQWIVLFNFNAVPSHSWKVSLDYLSRHLDITVRVDSVETIVHNSWNLRKQFLTYSFLVQQLGPVYSYTATAIERIGGNVGLFNLDDGSVGSCDMSYFDELLCYDDDQIGHIKFSQLPCDYANPASVGKVGAPLYSIYPNPASNIIHIQNQKMDIAGICIYNDLGIPVVSRKVFDSEREININCASLNCGIYSVQVNTSYGSSESIRLILEK